MNMYKLPTVFFPIAGKGDFSAYIFNDIVELIKFYRTCSEEQSDDLIDMFSGYGINVMHLVDYPNDYNIYIS